MFIGTSSGNQLDDENQYRRPTPHSNSRGQQRDNNRQPANLNTMNSFAGESEDRPTPPPRDTHVQSSVVYRGRQSTPVNRQSYSRAATTTTPLTGHPRVPCTAPAATVSRPAPVASTVTQGTVTVERQNLTEVTAVAGASAVPILESWGLPQLDTITNDGINTWIKQVIEAYSAGNPAALANSCLSMYRKASF